MKECEGGDRAVSRRSFWRSRCRLPHRPRCGSGARTG